MVTADHSHVFTMAGYPLRGNPIFGYAGSDTFGVKYSTLGYQNGPGARTEKGATLRELSEPNHQWESLNDLKSETHGGEDVGEHTFFYKKLCEARVDTFGYFRTS